MSVCILQLARRMSSWRRLTLALALPALLVTACAVDEEPNESAESEINYRSTAGQEFVLSTTVTFDVPRNAEGLEGEERERAVMNRAAALRNSVTSAISAELDRIWPQAERLSRAGVAIQFRQASASYSDLKPVGDRFSMTVSGEFGAVEGLARKLPLASTEDGRAYLPVSTDLGAGPEPLQVFLTPVERSRNAYPKYLELFEDGLDIGVHVGGDHHDPPMDISHARSIYTDLVASGFRSPVARFEDLAIDSPPFTKKIRVRGQQVDVRVRMYHVDMTTPDARQPLVDAFRRSMKDDDVVVYDGHAGRQLDYSGVVFAYKPGRVALAASEFPNVETTQKQQVYLFNGCETYTGYADKLYENPNRTTENTDVITTVNYSAIQRQANQVIAFLHAFFDERSGQWIPRSWDSVLEKMNAAGERSWVHVYGVHGLDDNPRSSPLADESRVGQSCRVDADCGAPDSRCIQVSGTRRVCGMACADTSGCPEGTRCALPRGRSSTDDLQCTPL